MGRRKSHNEVVVDVGDTDDVYDEVDQFHNEQFKDLGSSTKVKKARQTEVLSVEVDGLDDLYEDADLDKDEDDPYLNTEIPSANQWGKDRKEYYIDAKSRNREDGILNDEEQEALEWEEEDALERQRRLDSKTASLNFNKFLGIDDNQSAGNNVKPAAKLTLKEKLSLELAKKKKESESKSVPKVQTKTKEVEKSESAKKEDECVFVEGWDDYEHEVDGKDTVTEKRGITKQKRKKGTEHSRIKRRHQYKKALIKRRSQVPDVKRELNKYGGEVRGIRASTVRSIKIKA